MADSDTIEYPPLTTLTRTEIEYLADRLYGAGVSSISTIGSAERNDLVLASRALRRLLSAYERGVGRQLACIMLAGGC
jgi:hypothetical protein